MVKAPRIKNHRREGGKVIMATIQEKVKQLLELRNKVNSIKEQLAPIQAERDAIQSDIIKHMTRQGFDSVKTESATVSKAIRKTIVIENENALIADLKEKGLTDYFKEQIDKELWRPFSTQAIKENKIFAGCEMNETEFISVRSVKKK